MQLYMGELSILSALYTCDKVVELEIAFVRQEF